MPYTPLLVVVLLLVAIVIFAYFYLKRAQARDASTGPSSDPRDSTPPATDRPD
jgi:hypothetical protein